MYLSRFNKITIHSWGGLGSQLFTWSVAEIISMKFPYKGITIVLHNSGITKRESDIDFLSYKYKIVHKDDFRSKINNKSNKAVIMVPIIKFIRIILRATKIVIDANTSKNLNKIKPWTLILRGHYSHITIDSTICNKLVSEVEKFKNNNFSLLEGYKNTLGIHYRLGDLIILDNKFFIDPELLGNAINNFSEINKCESINLYSDSLLAAEELLSPFLAHEVQYRESNIWETIIKLSSEKYFIGTNSKISIWVMLFRKTQDRDSWVGMPLSTKVEVERIYPNISLTNNFFYY